ncbi:MAG: ABC transporter permease [Acidobacteriota bacterium]|jgi:putative ABC transport system permease protein
MEIGPIIKALFRSKTRFFLIGLEVALTLAIVINCINMILDTRKTIDSPTGMDEAGIIVIRNQPFAEAFKEDGYFKNARKADLDLLRSLPGVMAADAFSQIPLSGSGSSSGYKPLGSEMDTLSTNIFWTGTEGVASLGVRLIAGRNFTESDINDSDSKNVLVTKAYADKLFPDGDALGKQIQGREPDHPYTIVGIIEQMHGSWPTWRYVEHVMLAPGEPGSMNWGVRYMVRASPERVSALMATIEERLLALNDGRNVRLETLAEVKAHTFSSDYAVIKMLGAVIVLLIFVTCLGIVGMTSFSVTERLHHIGTRRALGARKFDILRYFLTENWLITTSGVIIGVALTYGLNYALVTMVDGAKLDWRLVAFGIAGMWIVGLSATLLPAWRGARVSPAIATRNV